MTGAASSSLMSTPRGGPVVGMRWVVTCSVTGTVTSNEVAAYLIVTVTGYSKRSPICSRRTFTPPGSVVYVNFRRGKRRTVDPSLEVEIEVAPRLGLERRLDVLRAGLLEPPRGVEPPHPSEEGIIANQLPQHVQRKGALVVDECPEHAAVVPDVSEAIAEIHGTLIGSIDGPARHLRDHLLEGRVLPPVFGVERGEILREALADPLLVIVLPAHRLSPPLMCGLMGEEKLGEIVEIRRVGAPRDRRRRRRQAERREVRRAMTARLFALDERERERLVRDV